MDANETVPRGWGAAEGPPTHAAKRSAEWSNAELALASVLALRGALAWEAAKRATALDDDALSDAVDALLLRDAIRLVRATEPEPVALALTELGAIAFTSAATTEWRVDRRTPFRR